ncbi:MAG: endopeptidase La [Chloroflexi bacterium]|nr:endopeptidase La [Chloroflexota bacterium]
MATGIKDFFKTQDAVPDPNGLIERPLIPLRGLVIFPNTITPIDVPTSPALSAIQIALLKKQTVIGAALRGAFPSQLTLDDLYPIGTEMAVGHMMRLPDDRRNALVQGRRRVQIVEIIQATPYPIVRARPLNDIPALLDETRSLMRSVQERFQRASEFNPSISEDVLAYALNLDSPGVLADLVASTLTLPFEDRQRMLEMPGENERLRHVADLLAQELKMLELKDEISSQVQQEMDRSQREIYLREQMRIIQTELGEQDFFQQEINEVRESILKAELPPEIHEKASRELSRLMMMPPMAPEVGMIRTYIDWLTAIPWVKQSEDNLNLAHAERILEADHYGLRKVKERILEYIAVRKLAGSKMKSPILCFVGPPGVGKTSLGRSIARALGREFVRVSLGGVRDEAEIRGHRRTYIGALPGRIIQTLRRAGTINPVFVLDEVDKLGMDFRGDPSSALLEVLDPEQNHAYSDHYLEVPYDLSKVLFITTANDLDPLPPALLDRLEVIEFSGYTEEEKVAIARNFLLPNQMEAHGLAGTKLSFETRALQEIIRSYTYEGGVRSLNREIANVARKVARRVAEDKPIPRRITAARLPDYLGPPLYLHQLANQEDAVGLATGLVWSYDGGDISVIEVAILPGKGSLTLTGQLGEVMQESAQTALSYVRSRASDYDLPHDDFENYDVHVHLPEGAVPKDGPSAGITLAAAILSAFTECKIRSSFAMTGEITLRGKVLPVGGIKEKVLAARRAHIHKVILPTQNKKDLVDIPPEAMKDLELFFVDDMQQVLDRVLLPPPPDGRKRDAERQENEKSEEALEAAREA